MCRSWCSPKVSRPRTIVASIVAIAEEIASRMAPPPELAPLLRPARVRCSWGQSARNNGPQSDLTRGRFLLDDLDLDDLGVFGSLRRRRSLRAGAATASEGPGSNAACRSRRWSPGTESEQFMASPFGQTGDFAMMLETQNLAPARGFKRPAYPSSIHARRDFRPLQSSASTRALREPYLCPSPNAHQSPSHHWTACCTRPS